MIYPFAPPASTATTRWRSLRPARDLRGGPQDRFQLRERKMNSTAAHPQRRAPHLCTRDLLASILESCSWLQNSSYRETPCRPRISKVVRQVRLVVCGADDEWAW